MSQSFNQVAEAFSRKARIYDAFGQNHPSLARMREQVYRHLLSLVQPPARILELNAGTGTDAVFLAQLGFSVHATDIAPGMIAQLRSKIERYGLEERLTAELVSFTELDRLSAGPFDCVFSNMGGLNCIDDLGMVARHLPNVLRRGGAVTWVIMPRFCLWEAAAILRGDWRLATRRLARGGTLANVEGVPVRTYYFSPRQVIAALGPRFQIESLQGLSVFAPPADRKNFPRRYPRLYRLLVWIDTAVAGRQPFSGWGDFFIITFRYLPSKETR